MRVIYGDVFFLINFSMDFLALCLVAKLSHKKLRVWRLLAAAALGGGYALAALFLPKGLEGILTLLVPLLMARIAYRYHGVWGLCKDAAFLFGVSFAIGGVMTAVYYGIGKFLSAQGILVNGSPETVYSDLPLGIILFSGALAALFAYLWGALTRRSLHKKRVSLIVEADGKRATVSALCDSGNLLEEPLGHLPVIIVTRAVMETLLPHGLKAVFFEGPLAADRISPRLMKKTRFIPTTTVGGESLLCGFLPDHVLVEGVEKRACLALDNTALDFDGADAILPTILLG